MIEFIIALVNVGLLLTAITVTIKVALSLGSTVADVITLYLGVLLDMLLDFIKKRGTK